MKNKQQKIYVIARKTKVGGLFGDSYLETFIAYGAGSFSKKKIANAMCKEVNRPLKRKEKVYFVFELPLLNGKNWWKWG